MDIVTIFHQIAAGIPLCIRRQTDDDLPFSEAVYIAHRWEEIQAAPWTDEQRLAFLRSQFQGQWNHYASAYYDADFLILESEGQKIGRLYLHDQNPNDLRIIDIGLMPEWRACGLGGVLLRTVMDYAQAQGKICSIHVEQSNPARHLYERLGFKEVKPVGPYFLLEWHP